MGPDNAVKSAMRRPDVAKILGIPSRLAEPRALGIPSRLAEPRALGLEPASLRKLAPAS